MKVSEKHPTVFSRYDRGKMKNDFLKFLKEHGLEKFYEQCCVCYWSEGPIDLAHLVPHRRNGPYELDNIVPLCPNHHRLYDYELMNSIHTESIKYFIALILSKLDWGFPE